MSYKVVCQADDPQWLEHRKRYVTASELVVVMGNQPKWWTTSRRDLIRAKQGHAPAFQAKRNMLWGSMCEEANMRYFDILSGCVSLPENVLLESTRNPRVAATLDGWIKVVALPFEDPSPYLSNPDAWHEQRKRLSAASKKGKGIIEAKQAAGWKGQKEKWFNEPPDYYYHQVQQQLYVTGADYAILFVRLGVDDMHFHVIFPDEFFHEELETAVDKFWSEVNG